MAFKIVQNISETKLIMVICSGLTLVKVKPCSENVTLKKSATINQTIILLLTAQINTYLTIYKASY